MMPQCLPFQRFTACKREGHQDAAADPQDGKGDRAAAKKDTPLRGDTYWSATLTEDLPPWHPLAGRTAGTIAKLTPTYGVCQCFLAYI
jgi:hypothetical protein